LVELGILELEIVQSSEDRVKSLLRGHLVCEYEQQLIRLKGRSNANYKMNGSGERGVEAKAKLSDGPQFKVFLSSKFISQVIQQ
jgi:hypothetical protein